VLAPFAPFLAEELYQVVMPGAETIHTSSWPAWDEATVQTDSVTVGVQVNGKVRAELVIAQADRENSAKVLAAAKAIPAVQPWLEGKTIVKEVYVPGKIVSIAVK
jgi:leucyl-tRNA synthetase